MGIQNNYIGMSPEQATKLAMDLFMDNFPRLQKVAEEIARSRAEELCSSVINELVSIPEVDYSAFEDPDVQYSLYAAQKSFARIGTSEMLHSLSKLVAKRIVQNDEDIAVRVALDKAIEVIPFLSKKHLDYLALLFGVTQVKYSGIDDITKLKRRLDEFAALFSDADFESTYYLNMHGCLQLRLTDVINRLSITYNIEEARVKAVCPSIITRLSGDYGTSHVGTVIAISHIENNTSLSFDVATWVHD